MLGGGQILRSQAVQDLLRLGQSIWLDELSRPMIESSQLAMLRDEGISGVTANPTTFDHAVDSSDAYDRPILERRARGEELSRVLWDLLVEDVQQAADVMHGLHESSGGQEGFVSVEVSPELAYDTAATISAAGDLWARCARPNVFVKIPATEAGLPAIRTMIGKGVNINVTLIFSVSRYRQVVDAFMSGLEDRLAEGRSLHEITSVASFFVSRVDGKVDALLEQKVASAPEPERARILPLFGRIGIANSKAAYQEFLRLHAEPRWKRLAQAGARPQRCLWASTSVKNPNYPPTKYVDELAGADSINTMPLKTFEAFKESGDPAPRLTQGLDVAGQELEALARLGIDLEEAASELEAEGVGSFLKSLRHLLRTLSQRAESPGA